MLSMKTNNKKVDVNLHIFWKNNTCTLIEELFRPVRLFLLEILSPSSPVRLLKTVRLLETLE